MAKPQIKASTVVLKLTDAERLARAKRCNELSFELVGVAKKAGKRDVNAIAKVVGPVPAEWDAIVCSDGARTFDRRLELYDVGLVMIETREWLDGLDTKRWTNFAKLVPDVTKLAIIAKSTDGDRVGFVGGKDRYLVFPAAGGEIAVKKDIIVLFGWYFLGEMTGRWIHGRYEA